MSSPAAWIASSDRSLRQGDEGRAVSMSAKALGTVLDMLDRKSVV